MQAAQPRELGVLQSGDHPQDLRLGAVAQLRLEADHVVERAERVVLAQLHHRVWLHTGIVGVGKPHRFSSVRGAASRGRARP